MELSKLDRWMLSNQFKILEKLYPDEAADYARAREVVEMGYELNYDWLCPHIIEAPHTVSAETSHEVIDILDMYSHLLFAFEKLGTGSGVDKNQIKFPGFSGNDEGGHWSYALFMYEKEGKFSRLDKGDRLNSHFPMLPRYRAMLEEWEKSADKYELSKDDILRIISAKAKK